MKQFDHLRNVLKATLPIFQDLDLDMYITSALLLAKYYHDVVLGSDQIDEDSKKNACAMLVASFDKKTFHYLEEVIEEFKEEGIL